MSRVLIASIAGGLCAVVATPSALGKDGVRARVEAPVSLAAAPGSTLTIVWTLSSTEGGRRRPFGAAEVFVRLRSASGGKSTKAHGQGGIGRYVARVTVPRGGIGGIDFGLEGMRYLGGGPGRGRPEDADVYFPLDNDPFAVPAGAARGSRTQRRAAADTGRRVVLWLGAAGLLGALALGLTARRARASRAGPALP
jgi:hypothetical protein